MNTLPQTFNIFEKLYFLLTNNFGNVWKIFVEQQWFYIYTHLIFLLIFFGITVIYFLIMNKEQIILFYSNSEPTKFLIFGLILIFIDACLLILMLLQIPRMSNPEYYAIQSMIKMFIN